MCIAQRSGARIYVLFRPTSKAFAKFVAIVSVLVTEEYCMPPCANWKGYLLRLADRYYGYSDPFRGYYDYHALPPLNPGYGYVRPLRWR